MSAAQSNPPPSLAGAPWLSKEPTQSVLRTIEASGYHARVVGGAVRNALLRHEVKDIDIATTATPDDVIRLAAAAGLATVPTGIKHGTVTVIVGSTPFEVTTLRRDVATDGRHATVSYTDDWEADARRRDFTINALYCTAEGTVHDPLGGYDDILAHRIRFIGDAGERIREDYLRILRFFRFYAEYASGPPDAEGLRASVVNRAGLQKLSGERIRQEFLRLLVAPGAVLAVGAMLDYGLLPELIGIAPRPGLLKRLVEIEGAQSITPSPVLRLALLSVETTEDALRLAVRLKLSAGERELLILAADHAHDNILVGSKPATAKEQLYRRGPEKYRDYVLTTWTRTLTASVTEPTWSERLSLTAKWTPPKFPLSGTDVLALGVEAGPRVGSALRQVEDWWIASGFPHDRQQLLAELGKAVASSRAS